MPAATADLPTGPTLRAIGGVLEGLAPLDPRLAPPGGLHRALLPAGSGRGGTGRLAAPAARTLKPEQLARRLRRQALAADVPGNAIENIALTAEQESARAQIASNPGPFLLFGSTGSGKTEVYLRSVRRALEADPHGPGAGDGARDQPHAPAGGALCQRALRRALAQARWCRLHSGMTDGRSACNSWLAAHSGHGAHRAGHAHGGACQPAGLEAHRGR